MANPFSKLIMTASLLITCTQVFAMDLNSKSTKLIYGSDDRYEVDNYPDADFREKAKSIAMMVPNSLLAEDHSNPDIINFLHRSLARRIPELCSTERFADQTSLGDCSGFLVSKNRLVTAGHCVMNLEDCKSNKWVFDFKDDTDQIKKSDVYSCKKIINQNYADNNKVVNDFAVIELDRVAVDRAPLKYRKFGLIKIGTPVITIGHPLGLPMKITDGAKVERMNDLEKEHKLRSIFLRENYFITNLDAYLGNSGSPVFNKNTGKVEGILIQGNNDFDFNYETLCSESRHLDNSHRNTAEKVMRITRIPDL